MLGHNRRQSNTPGGGDGSQPTCARRLAAGKAVIDWDAVIPNVWHSDVASVLGAESREHGVLLRCEGACFNDARVEVAKLL